MGFSRTDEYETIIDNSPIADSYARRLYAYPYNAKHHNAYSEKNSVQDVVADLTKRTGLSDYINIVNAQLTNKKKSIAATTEQHQISSLIDIAEIKSDIDKAIEMKKYPHYISLLNDLKQIVRTDQRIPENLKNVMGDEKLIEYLKSKMPIQAEKTNYNLGTTKDLTDESALDSNNEPKAAWQG